MGDQGELLEVRMGAKAKSILGRGDTCASGGQTECVCTFEKLRLRKAESECEVGMERRGWSAWSVWEEPDHRDLVAS